MGEDVTETLEVIPRQWKVIQTMREKFPGFRPFTPQSVHRTLCHFADLRSSCRSCEKISQPPAPLRAIPCGWAGPSLIAIFVHEKYGLHQPLNRQAERFAREGVALSLSTLTDLVGHVAVALQPIHALIETHVRAGQRLHGDDTTVPLLAQGGAKKARFWTYVRDDHPWNAGAPPAAFFRFSRDRAATNPNQHLAGWQGVLQADAYGGGYNDLYRADRDAGPVTSALC